MAKKPAVKKTKSASESDTSEPGRPSSAVLVATALRKNFAGDSPKIIRVMVDATKSQRRKRWLTRIADALEAQTTN